METLYTCGDATKGGAFWPIVCLLKHFHDVKIDKYTGQKIGVCLCRNTPQWGKRNEVSKRMRRVVFIGGYKIKDHGIPRKFSWNQVHSSVFQSEFLRRIARSIYQIKNSCVMPILGGAHADPDIMVPKVEKESPKNGEIHFLMIAKWWKRLYKRFWQHEHLFLNYILPKYPNAILHNFGNLKISGKRMTQDVMREGNIIYYRKTQNRDLVSGVYLQSHIQLILTPFDAGPMMVNESLHYRIPFICGNNSCASEFISHVGKCGEVVNIDPEITTARQCLKYKPMINKEFYNRHLNYELIMDSVNRIVENYEEYTSWNWTDDFNYKSYADKWMQILFG